MSLPRPTEERAPAEQGIGEPWPRVDPEVLCRACGHTITHPRHAIEVGGSHEHTFRNPAGYSFHVLCYAQAPGCLRVGSPTDEATWFPGYCWCYALCQGCRGHLGWWYLGPSDHRFAGLIATRLIRPRGVG